MSFFFRSCGTRGSSGRPRKGLEMFAETRIKAVLKENDKRLTSKWAGSPGFLIYQNWTKREQICLQNQWMANWNCGQSCWGKCSVCEDVMNHPRFKGDNTKVLKLFAAKIKTECEWTEYPISRHIIVSEQVNNLIACVSIACEYPIDALKQLHDIDPSS